MSEAAVIKSEEKLDDVMLAMDIVDTLRHRERIIDRELSVEQREAKLIERLHEIYAAQGIDVPDRILRDGVKALEEKRFVYEPPTSGLSVRLAKFYIARDRWLKPVMVIAAAAAFMTAAYEFGVEAPRRAEAESTHIELTQSLPDALSDARDAALAIAQTDNARRRIETAYQDGAVALSDENAASARNAVASLELITGDLTKDLSIRVVSRPGEMSGVFRIHDDDASVKNYYLIVEGVDARGRAVKIEIASEEDQAVRRVSKWGVRVPENVFNAIAADKQDDQIIQNAVIGQKKPGALNPAYSIDTAGGAILDW